MAAVRYLGNPWLAHDRLEERCCITNVGLHHDVLVSHKAVAPVYPPPGRAYNHSSTLC